MDDEYLAGCERSELLFYSDDDVDLGNFDCQGGAWGVRRRTIHEEAVV